MLRREKPDSIQRMNSSVRLGFALPLCAALLACGSNNAPTPSADVKAAAKDTQAEAAAREDATVEPTKTAADASTARPDTKAKFPPEARRNSPPPKLLASAVKVGAQAPVFTLEGSTGALALGDALSKTDHVVLVFYRGGW